MTVTDNQNYIITAPAMADPEDGFQDYNELNDDELDQIQFKAKEVTPNVNKIRRFGEVMKTHDTWMGWMRQILQILERVKEEEEEATSIGSATTIPQDLALKMDAILDCFQAIVLIHEDDDKHSEESRRSAFDKLRSAYGFMTDSDDNGNGVVYRVDSVKHILKFTRFLQQKLEESLNLLLSSQSIPSIQGQLELHFDTITQLEENLNKISGKDEDL